MAIKAFVKRAELNKCDIRLVSKTLWHERIPFFNRMEIMKFDIHRRLSAIIFPYKYIQHHSNKGSFFSLEETCDVEC